MDGITDELREWFKDRIFMANGWQEIRDIADRIDAELAERYVKLPVDADGVPIRVGDVMDGNRGTVTCIRDAGHGWEIVTDHMYSYNPADLHHHKPTVEDVLREFAHVGIRIGSKDGIKAGEFDFLPDEDAIAEYAKKLQLKEG